MSAGTYDSAKVSIKIDGRELGFDADGYVSGEATTLHGASACITIKLSHVTHFHGGLQHRHELLDDGRLGPATHCIRRHP